MISRGRGRVDANDLLLDIRFQRTVNGYGTPQPKCWLDAERALKTAGTHAHILLLPDSKRSRAEAAIEKELGRYDEDYRSVTARSSAHQASLKTLADLETRRGTSQDACRAES